MGPHRMRLILLKVNGMKDYEVIDIGRVFFDGDQRVIIINGRGIELDQDNSFDDATLRETFPDKHQKIVNDLTRRKIIKKTKKKEMPIGGD